MYLDFDGTNEFLGFYIPSSPKTYDACIAIADSANGVIEHFNQRIDVAGGYRDQLTNFKDLKFSGRVFLYHEDLLSIPPKAEIMKVYRAKNYDVQFRGPDFLGDQVIAWHREHDPKK